MIYLTVATVIRLHEKLIDDTGGSFGIRDPGAIASAVAQPTMTFDGIELYPTLADKASALAFSLINNHPFIDGNKRVGHAAMESFLVVNGFTLEGEIDEQESVILAVAAGQMERDEFTEWIKAHIHLRASASSADKDK